MIIIYWRSDVFSSDLQNETERVLRQHLDATFNFRPEWGTQLLSLKQDESGIEVGLRLADGSKETIRPRWVIGADGVRSRVRECLGIAYEGRSEEHTSELQSLMRISYAVFCLKKNNKHNTTKSSN